MLYRDFKCPLLTAGATLSLIIISVFFAAGLTSCGEKNVETPPPYVLHEDTFALLLVDFSLAESATSINIKNVKGNQLDSAYAFDPLKEHNISQGRYDSTLRFYSSHPEQYKLVYQKVLTHLSTLESARKGTKVDSIVAH